jgi:hypothetical protein
LRETISGAAYEGEPQKTLRRVLAVAMAHRPKSERGEREVRYREGVQKDMRFEISQALRVSEVNSKSPLYT